MLGVFYYYVNKYFVVTPTNLLHFPTGGWDCAMFAAWAAGGEARDGLRAGAGRTSNGPSRC
jgi:hypothetical protein